MDRLSLEIISMIFDEVRRLYEAERLPRRYANFATISRAWQVAVEPLTMKFIHVPNSPEGLSRFSHIFSQAHRRSYLRTVILSFKLPTNAATDGEHRQNEETLAAATSTLLHEIHHWERNLPDDHLEPLKLMLVTEWLDRETHLYSSPAKGRYLTLSDADVAELPKVQRMKHFQGGECLPGLALHPTSLCQLACVLPLLESVDFEFLDPGHGRPDIRLQHRNALAEGIIVMSKCLHRLRKFKLRQEDGDSPANHSFRCKNLQDEEGIDKLCEAIRILSQMDGFQELKLDIPSISSDLFWDRRHSASASEDKSVWPSLRRLQILCGIVMPSGEWYYTGDRTKEGALQQGREDEEFNTDYGPMNPGQESDDSDAEDDPVWLWPQHMWRMDPDPETLSPLAISMGAAVCRMPNLQSATLLLDFSASNWRALCLQCVEPSGRFSIYEDDGEGSVFRRWRVVLEKNTRWEVPAELARKTKAWTGKDPIRVQVS